MKIMNEVSLLGPHVDDFETVALDDPALYRYPVAYMTEAGYWTMTDWRGRAFRASISRKAASLSSTISAAISGAAAAGRTSKRT